jgi:hypothetical protein
MKPAAFALALAQGLAGCGLLPGGQPARLLTGPPGFPPNGLGCFTFGVTGRLIADPTYGTEIIADSMAAVTGTTPPPIPVAWRPGFTARWIGPEVEVLDPRGNQVALTGRTYSLDGGYVSAGGSSGLTWPELPVDVFWACDRATLAP